VWIVDNPLFSQSRRGGVLHRPSPEWDRDEERVTGRCPVMDKFTRVHRIPPETAGDIHRMGTGSG